MLFGCYGAEASSRRPVNAYRLAFFRTGSKISSQSFAFLRWTSTMIPLNLPPHAYKSASKSSSNSRAFQLIFCSHIGVGSPLWLTGLSIRPKTIKKRPCTSKSSTANEYLAQNEPFTGSYHLSLGCRLLSNSGMSSRVAS